MATKRNEYSLSDGQREIVTLQNESIKAAFQAAKSKADLLDETIMALGKTLEVPDGYIFNLELGQFTPAPPTEDEQIDLDSNNNDQTE